MMSDDLEANGSHKIRQTLLAKSKLKEASRISTLLSGFAMVAMVEVDLTSTKCNPGDNTCQAVAVPPYILILFSVVTTVLISVYLFALMVATCILPNLQTVKTDVKSGFVGGGIIPAHERFQHYITIAWAFSTVLGIIMFMAEFGLICWIKFWTASQAAAWVATAILIPVAFIFLGFALHFHRSLLEHKIEEHDKGLRELDELAQNLDNFSEDRDSVDSTALMSGHNSKGNMIKHV